MDGAGLKDGKNRVREALITPLREIGLRRPNRCTVDQHEAMLARLEARLAYMSTENLAALAEVVERHGEGKAGDIWPAELRIARWARDLQATPPSDSRLVTTYLRSAAGARAREGGYLVELYSYLKRHGAPPNSYGLETIRREADDNMRRRRRIIEAREAGAEPAGEAAWLEAWTAAQARAMAIIEGAEA